MKVLVGYSSAHGSTREIAVHLGARLGSHGLDTDVSELARVVDPGRYDAYVLGSAVHDQRWLPEARAFVAEHAPELAAKPVWLFSVGMPAALRFPLTLLAGLQPAALVAEFTDRLSFRDHLVVSGVVRDEHLSLLGRLPHVRHQPRRGGLPRLGPHRRVGRRRGTGSDRAAGAQGGRDAVARAARRRTPLTRGRPRAGPAPTRSRGRARRGPPTDSSPVSPTARPSR